MEGKEQRFGIAGSALFDVVTTVTSCGAVNSVDRVVHRDRRGGADGEPVGMSEVIFGGVGTGLYSMLVYVASGRVHRRADGRPHAGVSGQEDRGARDQADRARDADHAADGAVRTASRSPATPGARRSSARGPQGVLGDASTPICRRRTTTVRRSPATPGFIQPNAGNLGAHGDHVREHPRRVDDAVRALRRRSCSRSRSPARSRASGSARRGWGRCAPITRRSWCC